jgi:hypothetical protein
MMTSGGFLSSQAGRTLFFAKSVAREPGWPSWSWSMAVPAQDPVCEPMKSKGGAWASLSLVCRFARQQR